MYVLKFTPGLLHFISSAPVIVSCMKSASLSTVDLPFCKMDQPGPKFIVD